MRNSGELKLSLPALPDDFEYQVKVDGDILKINAVKGVYWKDGVVMHNWVYCGFEINTAEMGYDDLIEAVQKEVNLLHERVKYQEVLTREEALRHIFEQFSNNATVTRTLHLYEDENV